MIHKETHTPWQFLQNLLHVDRGPEHDETWMTECLQRRWPGPYKVVKEIDYQWQAIEYKIVFDSPEEETWFRLKHQ